MTEYFKKIDAMLAEHQMPQEYQNTESHIYCNDCEKKSNAKFHFLYHKCAHCKGYNTKVLATYEVSPAELAKRAAEISNSKQETNSQTTLPPAPEDTSPHLDHSSFASSSTSSSFF